ncbi:MAG: hypothetical protein AB8F74_13345, partial [Saprospiraceae bacterium]
TYFNYFFTNGIFGERNNLPTDTSPIDTKIRHNVRGDNNTTIGYVYKKGGVEYEGSVTFFAERHTVEQVEIRLE